MLSTYNQSTLHSAGKGKDGMEERQSSILGRATQLIRGELSWAEPQPIGEFRTN